MKSEKSEYLLKYQLLTQKYDLSAKQISEYEKKESSYLDTISW